MKGTTLCLNSVLHRIKRVIIGMVDVEQRSCMQTQFCTAQSIGMRFCASGWEPNECRSTLGLAVSLVQAVLKKISPWKYKS
jgi:hypothetical protein